MTRCWSLLSVAVLMAYINAAMPQQILQYNVSNGKNTKAKKKNRPIEFLKYIFLYSRKKALGVDAISFTGDAAKDFSAGVRGVARIVDGNGDADVGLPPGWPYSYR
jgi:hypothetical protein